MQFNQANGHHHQVGHRVVSSQERQQSLHQISELGRAAGHDFLVHRFCFDAPLPGVLKSRDLRGGFLAALLLKEDVVVGVGLERRVKVNQVDAGIRDVFAKNIQVIGKIDFIRFVHLRRAYHNLSA